MKRKKFIKLLMSKGYSRNQAAAWARAAVAKKTSYADVYKVAQAGLTFHQISRAISQAFKGVFGYLAEAAENVAGYFRNVLDSYKNE